MGIGNTLAAFKQISLQMKAQVYSVPGQTEGKKEGLFWMEKHTLILWTISSCGVNVNYYKSVHHPFPTCENRKHPGNFQNKSVSSAFNWVSRYILFLAKLKGRRRPFLEDPRRGTTLWDYPQEHLDVVFVLLWNLK